MAICLEGKFYNSLTKFLHFAKVDLQLGYDLAKLYYKIEARAAIKATTMYAQVASL